MDEPHLFLIPYSDSAYFAMVVDETLLTNIRKLRPVVADMHADVQETAAELPFTSAAFQVDAAFVAKGLIRAAFGESTMNDGLELLRDNNCFGYTVPYLLEHKAVFSCPPAGGSLWLLSDGVIRLTVDCGEVLRCTKSFTWGQLRTAMNAPVTLGEDGVSLSDPFDRSVKAEEIKFDLSRF